MSYTLIIVMVHSAISAADVQRERGFASYQECAAHAVAWADSQRPLSSALLK